MSEQTGGVFGTKKSEPTPIETDSDPIVVLTRVNELLNGLLNSMSSKEDFNKEDFNKLKFEFDIDKLTNLTLVQSQDNKPPNILNPKYLTKLNGYLKDKDNKNIFDIYKKLLLKYSES